MSALCCSAACLWRQMWIPPERSKSIHHFLTVEEYLGELKTAVSMQPFPQRWKRAKHLGVVICGGFAGWTANSWAEIHKSSISGWPNADNDRGWSDALWCSDKWSAMGMRGVGLICFLFCIESNGVGLQELKISGCKMTAAPARLAVWNF